MGHTPAGAMSSGNASRDLALGLAVNDQYMGRFASSMADELHRSMVDELSGGAPKGSKAARRGPKLASEARTAKDKPAVFAAAPLDHTLYGTPRRSRHGGSLDGRGSGVQGPSPTYAASRVVPRLIPEREAFYLNMSGCLRMFTDGRIIDSRIYPMASRIPDHPFQPRLRSLFICYEAICGTNEVSRVRPDGPAFVIMRGRTLGPQPVGEPVLEHPFWGTTASKSDAERSSSGVASAGYKRYDSNHESALPFYRAVVGPADTSYPWESWRKGDSNPMHIGAASDLTAGEAGSDLPAPPTSLRANPMSMESVHEPIHPQGKLSRDLSRASGNRFEEEGRRVAAQVNHFNELLRSFDPSRAHYPGEYEAWWNSSSRDAGRSIRWSSEETPSILLEKPSAPYDGHAGRFTYSEDSIRAGGDHTEGDEDSNEDDGFEADEAGTTTPGDGGYADGALGEEP